ncbi:MAG: cytochrome C [Clostridia bacterium]|nr:cytochrome C [Clostridia bacterium]
MKKTLAILLTLVLLAVSAVSFAEAAEQATCTYTIYNVTGEKVTELYAIDALTGEKGENYAGEAGIENGGIVLISKTVDADKTGKEFFVIDLTFVTEGGYTGHFGNLHFETVPISLLSAEAAAGATQISFFAPAN